MTDWVFWDIMPPSWERDQRLPCTFCLQPDTRVKRDGTGGNHTLKMEAAGSPETLLSSHQVRWRHIAADGNLKRSKLKR